MVLLEALLLRLELPDELDEAVEPVELDLDPAVELPLLLPEELNTKSKAKVCYISCQTLGTDETGWHPVISLGGRVHAMHC